MNQRLLFNDTSLEMQNFLKTDNFLKLINNGYASN